MWFGVKPKCVALELTEYYMKHGIFGDERFENTIEVISKECMSMNNAIGLALLRYWEFAAIDQKEIVSNAKTQLAQTEMAWEERLDSAEKVRQTVIKNLAINSKETTSH
ncbi:8020_t:CDS:2, partial [Gigaspora rosea]